MKVKLQLTHAKFFQLAEFVRNRWETILTECRTYDDLATYATKELGFEIGSNGAKGALSALGLKLKGAKRGPTKLRTASVLKKAVIALYQQLGLPVPEDLANLK